MPNSRSLLAAVFLAALSGCVCHPNKPKPPIAHQGVTPPPAEHPLELQPLPEAPQVDVPQEALPGLGGALAIVSALPKGEVRGQVRPVVVFNKPVTALASVEEQAAWAKAHPLARIEPALAGEWRWLGSAAAEFVPKGLVPYSTHYTVTVTKGLRSLDGATLGDDYAFSFDTPKLAVQDTSPDKGFAWLRPNQSVKVLLNQPVKDADLVELAHFEVQGTRSPWKVHVVSRSSVADERRRAEERDKRNPRRHERMSDEDQGYRNEQTRYELAADEPFPLDKRVWLVLPAALHGEQGPLPLGKDQRLAFKVYGRMAVTGAQMCNDQCAWGPLVLRTTNEGDLKSLQARLKVTPAVELDWDHAESHTAYDEAHGHFAEMEVPGKFRPGTSYQVSVQAGLADVFAQASSEAFSGVASTSNLPPSLYSGGEIAVIESGPGGKGWKPGRLPLEVTNLGSLHVRQWALTPADVARFLADGYSRRVQPPSGPPRKDDPVTLHFKRNERHLYGVDLGPVLGPKGNGIGVVAVNSPDLDRMGKPRPDQVVLAQVTDLAVHVKLAPKSSLAWVTRMSTGAPVAGAQVTAYDGSGRAVWHGTSDPDGFADVPGAVPLGLEGERHHYRAPFALIAAQVDDDTGFTSTQWSQGVEPYEFDVSQGWEGSSPESSGFLFTERGIYRPGDTVYLKGVARFRRVGALAAPTPGSELQLTVTDSRGQTVKTDKVKVTAYGTFSTSVEIPAGSPTGYFSAQAKGATEGGAVSFSSSFRVEEYRAPQFKVDVTAAPANLTAGENLNASVSARYLFGGAMSDAQVKWSVHRQSTSFSPPGNDGFSFDQETWWWDDSRPSPVSDFFASGEGRVDAKGNLSIAAGAVEAPAERTYRYTAEAEVQDVNRQTVAGRATVTVHPASYYVGLRAPTGFPKTGEAFHVDLVAVNPDGKRLGGREIAATLTRRTWKSVRQKDAGGGFTTVSEPAEEKAGECTVDSNPEAPAQCNFNVKLPGFYIAKATITDEKKRKHTASLGVYVLGDGFVAWQRNDTERVDLVPDKTSYDVGETAHVLIKSPYPRARALLTVEREGVLERRQFELEGSVKTVDIRITEEMIPNVFTGLMLMRPRVTEGGIESGDDPGRPAIRVGLVKLNVERKVKRLSVALKTDKPEYRPADTVAVDVAVRDAAGKGTPAEVTLYVVDEAVLRLTNYQVPDPIASIYPERSLSVRIGEPLLHLVRRKNYGEKGEDRGGGGGESAEGSGFRTNFKTTVAFKPDLETLADGNLHTTFKLPDNLTTFRIMAVVVTREDRFGSGETSIKVNKPLLALPAMPRFARVGDRFEAGVVIHGYGGGTGEVTVTATTENAKLLGPAEQKVQVTDAAPREVRFPFTAEKPGVAVFRFKAVRGADSDGVEEKIPVELPSVLETVATSGDTTDRRVEGVAPPKDAQPELGGLRLSFASTAMGNFEQGMRQLIEYPYGCLEQQSSRLVPFVALREISGKFGVGWQGPDPKKLAQDQSLNEFFQALLLDPLDVSKLKDPDQVVKATVQSIQKLQDPDGSFRYWADSSCPDSWASSYATFALHRAADVGYAVSPDVLDRADRFVEKVAGGGCHACEWECPDETRVFATYVLARAKKPKPSYYQRLYEKRESLPLFSQAQLADAMFVGGGDRGEARTLLQELLNHAKVSPEGVHFEETHGQTYAALWHSDTRTTGVVLETLADVQPDHPFVSKIAHYLQDVRRGDGSWRSTQEAAFSLIGLTEMVRTKEREVPDFTASAGFGGTTLFEQAFKGRSMAVKEKNVPMAELLGKAGAGKLTFAKKGTGVLYYTAALRYAPKELPMTPLDRGLAVQRWFEPFAGGGQSTRFYAGDLVRVRVRIATPQERHWTAFEVPLPAGLEPVDTSLATTASQGMTADEESRSGSTEYESADDQESGTASGADPARSPWAYRFWDPFNHVEVRDSRVVLFADHLPPGVHTHSFVARATTPGTFLLKPASGALMYEPEVFGRSAGGTFEVVLPTEVSER